MSIPFAFRSPAFFRPASLALLGALSGCHKAETVVVAPPPKPKIPRRVAEADLAKYRPNEAGAIMVLMYHRVRESEVDGDLNRRPATFRRDLQTLYDGGYYPVTALNLAENNMDVPIGKTPVVLTFDDALISQFHVIMGKDNTPHIDPNCAVGIMETFHKQHPDWPTRATFFVLPHEGKNGDPFGQAESVGDKFAHLDKSGYEVANHTSTHNTMRGMDGATVQRELATAFKDIKELAPHAAMQTFALPYGKPPRRDEVLKFLRAGTSGGQSYSHKAVFMAGWRPVLSPITRNDKKITDGGQMSTFDPNHLERVLPSEKQIGKPGSFDYWMQWFAKNPGVRYISDGLKGVVAVPIGAKNSVDVTRVQEQDKILQVYGGATGGAAGKDKSGSSLSVE